MKMKIDCDECKKEIGTKEEIMEDMVEAHKVERNKTVEILCEECYHEQPLGSLEEDYNAETFEARENKDGTIVLTDNEWNSCLHLFNGHYLWGNLELKLIDDGLKNSAKFKKEKIHSYDALQMIYLYERLLSKRKVRGYPSPNKLFDAESEDCEVCYTTVDKGTLNDVQAGRICNECHRMNQYDAESFNADSLKGRWDEGTTRIIHGVSVTKTRYGGEMWEKPQYRCDYNGYSCRIFYEGVAFYLPCWMYRGYGGVGRQGCFKNPMEAILDFKMRAEGGFQKSHSKGTYKTETFEAKVYDPMMQKKIDQNECTHKFGDGEDAWNLVYSDIDRNEFSYVYATVKCNICSQRRYGSWGINEKEGFEIVKGEEGRMPKMYGFYGAETFNVEFNEWADQELMSHGKDISFKDWAQDEGMKHGNTEITEWAQHEDESHDARYGAEEHRFMIACGRCGWNFTDEYIKNNTDGNIRPMYGDHCSCGGMVKRYDFEPEAKPKGFFKKLFGKNAEHYILKNEGDEIIIQMTDDWATIDNAKEIIDNLVDKHGFDDEYDYKDLTIYFHDIEGNTLRTFSYNVRGNEANNAIIEWFSDYDYPVGGYTAESFNAEIPKELDCKDEPYEHSTELNNIYDLQNLHDWSNTDDMGIQYCLNCGQYALTTTSTRIMSDEEYQELRHGYAAEGKKRSGLLSEPFEGTSLDSGEWKGILTGFSIGLLGLFGYSKLRE